MPLLCVAQSGIDLAGKPVDPVHQSPAKPTVLIFVRTDCPISSRYAPEIQRLSSDYTGRAAFWLIFPDKSTTAEQIRNYAQSFNYKLPALRDPEHQLVKLASAQITPEAAVFNPNGELVYHGRIDNWYVAFGRSRPAPTTHELEQALEAVTQGKKPAVSSAPAVGCYISDLQ